MKYYPINEEKARQAKHMNSFFEYTPGSATASYRAMVDEAVALAEQQKERVDEMYHAKIDNLLDAYCRKLADNLNKGYEIETRCPSIMVSGGANFPVNKKVKQNAARDRNMAEYTEVQKILDKIRGTGTGGISSDDPQAIEKLKVKLARQEAFQQMMRDVNAFYRKNKTLDGCPSITQEEIESIKAEMSSQWHIEDKPYPSFMLSNNSAEIRRLKARIKKLEEQKAAPVADGWDFDGGSVVMCQEDNRLRILFDDKPESDVRDSLKQYGFRWSPKNKAWQRMLNDNACRAAKALFPPAE